MVQKVDAFTQTDSDTEITRNVLKNEESSSQSAWNVSTESKTGVSLADQVKEAAESALTQSGMVFDGISGMYYDYNSGYYYNGVMFHLNIIIM